MILVDINNTHNFLDLNIIPKTKLTLKIDEKMEVSVANGELIKSVGKLEGAKFLLQGHFLKTDFFLLPLGTVM